MSPGLKRDSSRVSGSASSALPGRKLATSTKPRMLKPFEIDLLRQDLHAALKLLGQEEIHDAHALMRDEGFRPGDFEIIRHAGPSSDFPDLITGTVTLVRESDRASKTYEGDNGSWPVQFETDLKHGVFGPHRSQGEITG